MVRARGHSAPDYSINAIPGETVEALTTKTSSENKAFGLGSSPSGRAEGIEWREPANFERLYRMYSRRVYSLCMRMTGDTAKAEDLTQEAFVHLYRKLDTFRGESAFYTWFYRLAVNVVLMQLRKARKAQKVSIEDSINPDPIDPSARPQEIRATDGTLTATLDRVNLQRAIDALPPGYRTVFVLHDIEGYEHHEISEMTALSVGTSKSQLHKARLRLRTLLCEGPEPQIVPRKVRWMSPAALRRAPQAEPLPAT